MIGLLGASVLIAGLWIAVELRSAQPLIDMRMMRRPAVWTANLVAFLFGIGMYATFAFVPEFVQTPSSAGYGFSASIIESGLIVLPYPVTMFIVGTLSGRWSARYGARAVLIAGAVIGIVPFIMLTFARSSIWEVSVAMTLGGVCTGLAFSAMSNIIVDAVPSSQTGVASGMNANIRTIGGSIGAAAVASLITAHLQSSGLPEASGYTAAFTLLVIAAALAALAALLVPKLRINRDEHQREQATMTHAEPGLVAAGTLVGDESE